MPVTTTPIELIPNELKIKINTSIPGYQQLSYTPSMTMPNISEKKVCFNPLIYLDKDLIEKIPVNLRQKQFFNSGLFYSLTNYLKKNSFSKNLKNKKEQKNLLVATEKGFVDNNIQVIVDLLFKENNILYIDKKPYIIVKSEWNKGDWNVDTKKKQMQIDSSKIRSPFLRAAVIDNEIDKGKKQIEELKKILPDVLVGNHFIPVVPAPVKKPPEKPIKPVETKPIKPVETKPIKPVETKPIKPPVTKPIKPPVTKPIKPVLTIEPPPPESTALILPVKKSSKISKTQTITEENFDEVLFMFINIARFYFFINKGEIVNADDLYIVEFEPYNKYINNFNNTKQKAIMIKNFKHNEEILTREIKNAHSPLNKDTMKNIILIGKELLQYFENNEEIVVNPITKEEYNEYEENFNTNFKPKIFIPIKPSKPSDSSKIMPSSKIPIKKKAEPGKNPDEDQRNEKMGSISKFVTNIRTYLYQPKYYEVVNVIYKMLDNSEQEVISDILNSMVKTDIKLDKSKNLSDAAYKSNKDCIKLTKMIPIDNPDKKNLYFHAIAYALNMHNYTYNSNLITLELETKDGLQRFISFDFMDIKNHVYYSFLKSKSKQLKSISDKINGVISNYNKLFDESIASLGKPYAEITEIEYLNIIYEILYGYKTKNDNLFIVYSDEKVEKTPFSSINLDVPDDIHNYFYFAYKGDEKICNKFLIDAGLNCITISLLNKHCVVDKEKEQFVMLDKYNNPPKYNIFLYKYIVDKQGLNYAIMNFDYSPKKSPNLNQYIFINTPGKTNFYPPISLLFLIYARLYNPNKKTTTFDLKEFNFYQDIMQLFDKGLEKLKKNTVLHHNFKKVYDSLFQNTEKPLHGGNGFNSPYLPKTENVTQIAYYITIDMEVYPGDDPAKLPAGVKRQLKCTSQWNSVEKSYNQLIGNPHIKKPNYNLYNMKDPKKSKKQFHNYRDNNYTRRPQYDKKRYNNYTRRPQYDKKRYNNYTRRPQYDAQRYTRRR